MLEGPSSVNVLILDMDNTLYDWVGFFVPALQAMAQKAAELLNAPVEEVRSQLQEVHRRYGNTEHPFALLETQLVRDRFPGATRAEIHKSLDSAFYAFNRERSRRLRLYADVRPTLESIRDTGCKILGHTEATVINIASRLRWLDVLDLFDMVYASPWSGLEYPVSNPQKQAVNPKVAELPTNARKPDPEALEVLLNLVSANKKTSLYVGDSLDRDVLMANRAGIHAAWARYGKNTQGELWNQLVSVTHWTSDGVQRANLLPAQDQAMQFVELESFRALLQHYTFIAPGADVPSGFD